MARDKRPEQLPARDCATMSLPEFIEYASGGSIDPPYHLGDYFDLCQSLGESTSHLTTEATIKRALHICVSMPPQHGKTTLIAYTIAWLLFRFPYLLFGYGSYAKLFSSNRTEEIMKIYVHAGGELQKDHARKDDWRTAAGGGMLAFSPGSGIAGYQMHHIVFDDFVENEVDLDTADKRTAIHRDMDRALQRLWVGGSVIAIGTRWHHEDPIGYLLSRGYDELNLPAVREVDGVEFALWPEVKPLEWLDTKRLPSSKEYVGAYAWETQYQGKPVPPSGAIFGKPRYYDKLPSDAVCVALGVDLAYDENTANDWSIVVALFAAPSTGLFYVHDVRREQTVDCEAMLKQAMIDYPDVRLVMYFAGPEKGVLNLLFNNGVPIVRLPARHNKWTRARRTSIAWKTGRILVRAGQKWTVPFVRVIEYFTGAERGRDDDADALVAAHDLIAINEPVAWAGGGFTFGSAVM
jgi:hypothetical protein